MKLCYEYVSCDSNENICEATITITFPCKQTMMKHDMDKFNFTQFECTIRNLVNLLVKREKALYVFPASVVACKLLTSDHILVICNGNIRTYNLQLQPKLAWHHLVPYNDNITTCNGNLVNCKGNLVTYHGILVTCHLQW